MPKVSVIMVVYNCKNKMLLKKSIISILNQSYKDFEFLICDDGSEDDTLKYLLEVSKIDTRIRVLSYKENRGLANALNLCIKEAKGEYIARQDDDDVSYKCRLEKQVSFLENNNTYAFVGTLADVYDDDGIYATFDVPEIPKKESFFWTSPYLHPSVVFKKNALKKVQGYRVAKETMRCEDYDLFMRMNALNINGYNIQEKLYMYRVEKILKKKKIAFKYRVDEFIVRFYGFKQMGVLFKGFPFIFKPLVLSMIPVWIYNKINKIRIK